MLANAQTTHPTDDVPPYAKPATAPARFEVTKEKPGEAWTPVQGLQKNTLPGLQGGLKTENPSPTFAAGRISL